MNILRFLQKWDYVSLFCCIVLVVGQVYLDLKLPEYLNLVIQYHIPFIWIYWHF